MKNIKKNTNKKFYKKFYKKRNQNDYTFSNFSHSAYECC